MSIEVLSKIQQAEQEAANIREEAVEQVREMIRSSEEELSADAQKAMVETRQSVQDFLEKERRNAQTEIDAIHKQKAEMREALRSQGMERIQQASSFIIDRVLKGL